MREPYEHGHESPPPMLRLLETTTLKYQYVRACNLGVKHPQNGRPIGWGVHTIMPEEWAGMQKCHCGAIPEQHHHANMTRSTLTPDMRHLTYLTRQLILQRVLKQRQLSCHEPSEITVNAPIVPEHVERPEP